MIPCPPGVSGIYVPGDAKSAARLISPDGHEAVIITQNQEEALLFEVHLQETDDEIISPPANAAYAEIHYPNQEVERREMYFGMGYGASPTNRIVKHRGIERVVFYDGHGEKIRVIQ